ncbi:MAG: alpha/beta fold hydrolase [Clostridiales bacterium]|nr:alpha/beta fold hydrolase [Clostridiales bacterium]
MTRKKHLLSIILSLALTAACVPAAFAAESAFTDVDTTSYYSDAVDYMSENGYIAGMTETTFGPDVTVSRAMAVTVLYRMSGEASAEYTGVFSDVAEDAYYAEAVEWAAANGIAAGYVDGTFAPNASVSRQDLASFIYRYAKAEGADVAVADDESLADFADADDVSDYAKEALTWAVSNGIIYGTDNGLEPAAFSTRAQLAVIDYRYATLGAEAEEPAEEEPAEEEEPEEEEEEAAAVTVETITVASTTREEAQIPTYVTLPADYSTENTYPMVILCHGHGGNHNEWGGFDTITNGVAENGIIAVTLDYPGCGDSTESFQLNTMTNMKNDTMDVLNYVIANYSVDADSVGIFGYSMGGRIALELVADEAYDFAALELVAPAEDTEALITNFGGEEVWEEMKAEANENGYIVYTTVYDQVLELSAEWFADIERIEDGLAEAAAEKYDGNSLVIYAVDDTVVLPEVSIAVAEILGSEVAVTPADGHSYGFYGTTPETITITNDGSINFFVGELIK